MGKGTGKDLVQLLEDAFARPAAADGEEWTARYTPDEGVELAGELADLEAQLDAHWPGWRERKPFHDLPEEKVRWIKARLKRRALILEGRGAWGVAIVPGPKLPHAVPVKPTRTRTEAAFAPLVSVPLLVQVLGMDAEMVRRALARRPTHVRDVRSWLRSGRGREPGAAHPFPCPVAPPAPLPGGGT